LICTARPPFFFVLIAIAAVGCGSSVTEARVVTAPPPPAAAAAADLERYELEAQHLQVEADVSAGKAYTIAFPVAKGVMELSPSHPEASSVTLDVDISSATSSLAVVADVAKTRFLHTDRFPKSAFVSRGMQRGAQGLELFVDFTLHGTKKTLVVPATVEVTPCRARFSCAFAFSREAFGVVDDGSIEAFVSDEAVVRAVVDVARKGAPPSCTAGPGANARAAR